MLNRTSILVVLLVFAPVATVFFGAWPVRPGTYARASQDSSEDRQRSMTSSKRHNAALVTVDSSASSTSGEPIIYATPTAAESFPLILQKSAALKVPPPNRTDYFKTLVIFQGYTVYQWAIVIAEISHVDGDSAQVTVTVSPRIRGPNIRPVFIPASLIETWMWNGKELSFVRGKPAEGSSFAVFTD